ncbi:MAG: 5-methylthioadenosine/S-adenosylhomocysteine deaminase [Bacteroidetes bacterium ADurb.Bin408]|nr:MAG: 5-methylthioadenosine/S-adenosylhomocysteine deaminase [Bacteroidetes bacterium ADurb.Bin408]
MAEKYNSGIHVHTAEDIYDQTFTMQNYHKSVVERFHKAGALQFAKTILVHCLHLNDNERKIIAESPVYVAENIESNLNNNVGFFNGRGISKKVMLGTDGMHSNMLRSLKAAYIIGQTSEQLAMTEACERLNRTHEYIASNNFKGDAANNLVVLDYASPTPVTRDNYFGHLVFGIESADILHVIAKGKIIVRDRKLLTFDEEAVSKKLSDTAASLWYVYKKQKV